MATTDPTEYIASTIPAQNIFVSLTTLFQIAEQYFGDPLRWVEIAELNGITDPWIFGNTEIYLPPVLSSVAPDGILGKYTPTPLVITAPVPITYPSIPKPPVNPYLNSNGAMAVDPHGNLIV